MLENILKLYHTQIYTIGMNEFRHMVEVYGKKSYKFIQNILMLISSE